MLKQEGIELEGQTKVMLRFSLESGLQSVIFQGKPILFLQGQIDRRKRELIVLRREQKPKLLLHMHVLLVLKPAADLCCDG